MQQLVDYHTQNKCGLFKTSGGQDFLSISTIGRGGGEKIRKKGVVVVGVVVGSRVSSCCCLSRKPKEPLVILYSFTNYPIKHKGNEVFIDTHIVRVFILKGMH